MVGKKKEEKVKSNIKDHLISNAESCHWVFASSKQYYAPCSIKKEEMDVLSPTVVEDGMIHLFFNFSVPSLQDAYADAVIKQKEAASSVDIQK